MNSYFTTYLELGLWHILDWKGYDHILFIMVMACGYTWSQWKEAVGMATAFTVGHSLTLGWCVLQEPVLPSVWVEVLIPLTIIATCISHLVDGQWHPSFWVRYGMTAVFGLIHGMGFSNFLKAMLTPAGSLWWPLASFNLGVEVGQVLVLIVCLGLSSMVHRFLNVTEVKWRIGVALYGAGAATVLLLERL